MFEFLIIQPDGIFFKVKNDSMFLSTHSIPYRVNEDDQSSIEVDGSTVYICQEDPGIQVSIIKCESYEKAFNIAEDIRLNIEKICNLPAELMSFPKDEVISFYQ
jgi:hypothetical protein